MPEGVDWRDYFAVDKVTGISVDMTPCYPTRTIEETDEYRIYTTA